MPPEIHFTKQFVYGSNLLLDLLVIIKRLHDLAKLNELISALKFKLVRVM
jgi:hypothetical protein